MKRQAAIALAVLLSTACSASPRTTKPEPKPPGRGDLPHRIDTMAEATPDEPTTQPTTQPTTEPATTPESAATEAGASAMARPSDPNIDRRVAAARKRLESTQAGKLVWAAIEAHGGLKRWYANGPIRFRFTFDPVAEGRATRDTYETVDTWSARARHQLPGDDRVEFGWDGARAWVVPSDADLDFNVRFWSLTPYYFVAIPFVFADPGVQLEKTGSATLDATNYDLVKATFESGVGDAPDDHYILYVDLETHRVAAIRYVVSYPGFFENGGHSPEHLMIFDGTQTVDGIVLPTSYRTFAWKDGKRGKLITNTKLTDVAFRPKTPSGYFDPPKSAKILKGY